MWAIVIVVVPLPTGHPKIFSIPVKSISNDSPVTTSGITSGAVIAPTNSVFPLNLSNLVMTIAAIVPRITDTVAEKHATLMLVKVARKIIGLDTRALYHFSENLVHVATSLDSLKE
jgi:hypothetical protein